MHLIYSLVVAGSFLVFHWATSRAPPRTFSFRWCPHFTHNIMQTQPETGPKYPARGSKITGDLAPGVLSSGLGGGQASEFLARGVGYQTPLSANAFGSTFGDQVLPASCMDLSLASISHSDLDNNTDDNTFSSISALPCSSNSLVHSHSTQSSHHMPADTAVINSKQPRTLTWQKITAHLCVVSQTHTTPASATNYDALHVPQSTVVFFFTHMPHADILA